MKKIISIVLCAIFVLTMFTSCKDDNPSVEYITIKGEQYSTTLTDLRLYEMDLQDEDIVPLQYMINLAWLDLSKNQIGDISALSGLTNLTWLNLSYNQIDDINALSGLTNLTYLDLTGNPIIDWSPVSHIEDVGGRP